jgi:hypothetical protein
MKLNAPGAGGDDIPTHIMMMLVLTLVRANGGSIKIKTGDFVLRIAEKWVGSGLSISTTEQ